MQQPLQFVIHAESITNIVNKIKFSVIMLVKDRGVQKGFLNVIDESIEIGKE